MKNNLSSSFLTGLLLGAFIGVIGRLVFVHEMIKEDKLKDLTLFGRNKKIKI